MPPHRVPHRGFKSIAPGIVVEAPVVGLTVVERLTKGPVCRVPAERVHIEELVQRVGASEGGGRAEEMDQAVKRGVFVDRKVVVDRQLLPEALVLEHTVSNAAERVALHDVARVQVPRHAPVGPDGHLLHLLERLIDTSIATVDGQLDHLAAGRDQSHLAREVVGEVARDLVRHLRRIEVDAPNALEEVLLLRLDPQRLLPTRPVPEVVAAHLHADLAERPVRIDERRLDILPPGVREILQECVLRRLREEDIEGPDPVLGRSPPRPCGQLDVTQDHACLQGADPLKVNGGVQALKATAVIDVVVDRANAPERERRSDRNRHQEAPSPDKREHSAYRRAGCRVAVRHVLDHRSAASSRATMGSPNSAMSAERSAFCAASRSRSRVATSRLV